MRFTDDFDVTVGNVVYYVEVEGYSYIDDVTGETYYEIVQCSIGDESGEDVLEDHDDYSKIMEHIHSRDYQGDYDDVWGDNFDGEWEPL